MKKVLLTGATGFIGRHCLPLLVARGYEVHAVSSKPIVERAPHVHWHRVDLLDYGQLPTLMAKVKPNYFLHMAWYSIPVEYWMSTENLRWLQSSLELLRAFESNGGQRVVMSGTCAEYDWKYGYCSEGVTPLSPLTLYGVCKHSLQIVLDAFTKQTGLSSAWGRIFFLFGPSERPERFVASVISSLLLTQPARCSSCTQIRDFLYVEDVADAFVSLLESKVSGPVNIASGEPVILKDLVHRIANRLNRQDLIQIGALPNPPNDPPLLIGDVSRLRSELGWSPKYSLDSGIDQTIQWWKIHLLKMK